MGCDIHEFVDCLIDLTSFLEDYFIKDIANLIGKHTDKYWLTDRESNIGIPTLCNGRWYDLFSVLAGVRGNLEPLKEPANYIESNTSHFNEIKEYKESDGFYHHFTHYYLEELDPDNRTDYWDINLFDDKKYWNQDVFSKEDMKWNWELSEQYESNPYSRIYDHLYDLVKETREIMKQKPYIVDVLYNIFFDN